MKHKPRLINFIVLGVLLFFVLGGGYFLYRQTQGHFHTITPNEAYRSAQLNKNQLEYYIKKYNIKSILNLRNEHLTAPWSIAEINICKEYNISYYNIPLSPIEEPKQEEIEKLMDFFEHAPRPVLIHCKAGVDRSGLVAAMWKIVVDKTSKEEAGKQLSFRFFHFPIGKVSILDRFLKNWDYSLVDYEKENK